MKKILICLLLAFFLFINSPPIIRGEEFGASFEKGECAELLQTCDNCTYVNISSITFPNSTKIALNAEMTKVGTDYNYTFCSTNTLGQYQYNVYGDKDGETRVETITFEITPSGIRFDEGQAIGGIGVFIGILAVAFAFLFVGSKLTKEDKTLPIGFFFIVMAIILVIFSLYLGWAFSAEILQHEILSEGISRVFILVIWTSSGITIIFFALMLIAFIKELSKILKTKKFGADFNPITDTYE